MSIGTVVATVCLGILAVGHSVLGERKIIEPFLRTDLSSFSLGATFVKRVVRFAWHLTSVAWLGLAAALWAAPGSAAVVGVTLLVSGAITLVGARGRHFAWALFATAGLSLLHRYQEGPPPAWLAWTGAAVAASLALLHVAWALGLGWGLAAATPSSWTAQPGRVATLAVAFALGVLAAIFLARGRVLELPGASALALVAAVVFALRTVGDFHSVGLFRRPANDAFARNDASLYTPLCFALAAALLWMR